MPTPLLHPAAPASLLSLPPAPAEPCPAAARRVPLQLAIHNAQRVRLGQDPLLGAWQGCGRSAWCDCLPRHAGPCTACALVPGLLAYPSHELFESGVNIEELCRWVGGWVPGTDGWVTPTVGVCVGGCASTEERVDL